MTLPASLEPPGRAFEAVGNGGPRDMVIAGPFGGWSQNPAYGRLGIPLLQTLSGRKRLASPRLRENSTRLGQAFSDGPLAADGQFHKAMGSPSDVCSI